ncbi:MAG: hypothetical protein O3C55_00170 [Proteobacteria bacterium]|nr:hypothetical protein [Pseudomonadota bacterium]
MLCAIGASSRGVSVMVLEVTGLAGTLASPTIASNGGMMDLKEFTDSGAKVSAPSAPQKHAAPAEDFLDDDDMPF